MNRLVDAIKQLFATTASSGGELAKTANFALDNVNWNETLCKPVATGHHIVDAYLESACADPGPGDSASYAVQEALMAVTDQLAWRASGKCHDGGPDIEIFQRKFAVTTIFGEGALLPTDKVYSGFSLQAPDTYYPPHAHRAEESYWIIGGDGDWKVGTKPWFGIKPGDSIYHEPHARHAMQTNEQPLLTVWLWTSHLDSEVLIVRI